MVDNETAGQYVAKVLSLMGALVTGDPIEIKTTASSSEIEVTGITRAARPGAPVMVSMSTAYGDRVVRLDEIELAA